MSSELVKFELNCIQAIQLILSLYQFQAKKTTFIFVSNHVLMF